MTPQAQPELPAYINPAWTKLLAWFQKTCEEKRPLWDMRIAEVLAASDEPRPRQEIEKMFADSAMADLQALRDELTSMLMRTTIVVAASSLIFAAFVVKGNAGKGASVVVGTTVMGLALLTTAVAFGLALKSLAPPFMRAMKDPYEKREHWTLLVTNDFERWVLACWVSDRRTPVITRYKKAHAIAVPLLVTATFIALPGLALVILG